MTSRRQPHRRPAAGTGALLALMAFCLGACQLFPGPDTPEQREALAACRSEANRLTAARNPETIAERPDRDAPFSGDAQRPLPSDGLSDRYAYDQLVSDCLKSSPAVPVAADAR